MKTAFESCRFSGYRSPRACFTVFTVSAVFTIFTVVNGQAHAIQAVNIADAVEKVMDGVVNIRTRDAAALVGPGSNQLTGMRDIDKFLQLFLLPGQSLLDSNEKSLGSGFFYLSREYVITNNHVIKDAVSIEIVTAKSRYGIPAKVIGTDARSDIAVLRVEQPEKTVALRFGSSEKSRIGEGVFTIGNPFGYGHTVTMGILSAKGRTIGTGPFDDFLQTDAAINPGNSGGPLFNFKGEVIGINTAIHADARGISFAIPSEIAKPIIDALITRRKTPKAWIGVVASEIREESSTGLVRQSYGLYVQNLAKDSPAQRGGLVAGDVILGFNGAAVRDTGGLVNLLKKIAPGEKVTLKVYRNGRAVPLTLQTSTVPDDEAVAKMTGIF